MSTVAMDPRLRARRVAVRRLQGRRRLRILIGLVVALVTVGLCWWLIMRSPFLDVDAVKVSGVDQTDPAVVLDAAGIALGQPLVEVDAAGARAEIVELPWVASVTSARSWSGDVVFTVTERVPVAVVAGTEGWLLVDAHGRVLEVLDAIPAGVVVVSGSTWAVSPGGWVGEGALPALEVAALLPGGLQQKVASIDTAGGALELVLFGGGRVTIGDPSGLEDKFLSTLTLLSRLDLTCLDRIDVRAPSVPVLTRVEGCS